jgi:hypothetical protein
MRRAAQHQPGKITVAPGTHDDTPGTEIPGLPDDFPGGLNLSTRLGSVIGRVMTGSDRSTGIRSLMALRVLGWRIF